MFSQKNIILLLIVFSPLLGLHCGEPSRDSPKSAEHDKELPDQELWDSPENPVLIRLTVAGLTKHIIRAGHIRVFSSRTLIELDGGITVDFFDDKGNNTSVLTAERGMVYENTRDLIAFGKVVVRSGDKRELATEELRWYEKEQKIVAPDFTRITMEDGYEEGYNFKSNATLTHFTLNNVRGKVSIPRKLGEQ